MSSWVLPSSVRFSISSRGQVDPTLEDRAPRDQPPRCRPRQQAPSGGWPRDGSVAAWATQAAGDKPSRVEARRMRSHGFANRAWRGCFDRPGFFVHSMRSGEEV